MWCLLVCCFRVVCSCDLVLLVIYVYVCLLVATVVYSVLAVSFEFVCLPFWLVCFILPFLGLLVILGLRSGLAVCLF